MYSKPNTWLLMSSAALMGQYYFGAILLGRVGSRTYSVFTQFAHFALKKLKKIKIMICV